MRSISSHANRFFYKRRTDPYLEITCLLRISEIVCFVSCNKSFK
jgi:hypothetical protein